MHHLASSLEKHLTTQNKLSSFHIVRYPLIVSLFGANQKQAMAMEEGDVPYWSMPYDYLSYLIRCCLQNKLVNGVPVLEEKQVVVSMREQVVEGLSHYISQVTSDSQS